MPAGLIAAAVFVGAVVALNRYLRRADRQGYWDKKGYGPPEHPTPGVTYRPLEVPPSPPFD